MNSSFLEELYKKLLPGDAGFASTRGLFDQIKGGVRAEGSEHPTQGEMSPSRIVEPQAKVGCQI